MQSTGFSTLQKFLIVLGVLSVGGLSLVVWNTFAGTQIATTLKLSSATGGLDNGLVGHWTFDGVDMPSGQVNDTSGNGNNGSQQSMSTSSAYVQGVIGQALQFNRTDTNDDVLIPAFSSLNLTGDFTISAWVKFQSVGSKRSIIEKGQDNALTYGFQLQASGVVDFQSSAGGNFVDLASVSTMSKDTWVHLTGVHSGSKFSIYVNGIKENETTQAGTLDFPSQTFIFANQTNGAFPFSGTLDDVRVYNRALSADEAKQLYQLGATTKFATTPKPTDAVGGINNGLVGYWTFDGKDMPSGQVNDISGQGNNGSAQNTASSTSYVPGAIGQAFRFDGSNDTVRVNDSNSLDVTTGVTVSTWFKMDSIPGIRRFLAKNAAYTLHITNTTLLGMDIDNGACSNAATVSALQPGLWYHLVGTYQDGAMVLYLNGAVAGTDTDSCGSVDVNANDLYLGSNSGSSLFLPGAMDDTRVYNRVLSADEVKQLYQLGATTKFATTPKQTDAVGGINNSLVGYWTFDGKDMPGGLVKDISGQGYNASMKNMASSSAYVSGRIGQALAFDGINDQIRNAQVTAFTPTTDLFSVSVWIKALSSGYLAFVGKNTGEANDHWGLKVNQGFAVFQFRTASGANIAIATSTTSVLDGEWHHIAGVRSGVGTALMYVDGRLQTTNTFSGSTGIDAATQFIIGDWDPTNPSPYKGTLDDFRFYNRAISSDEVKQLYQMGR